MWCALDLPLRLFKYGDINKWRVQSKAIQPREVLKWICREINSSLWILCPCFFLNLVSFSSLLFWHWGSLAAQPCSFPTEFNPQSSAWGLHKGCTISGSENGAFAPKMHHIKLTSSHYFPLLWMTSNFNKNGLHFATEYFPTVCITFTGKTGNYLKVLYYKKTIKQTNIKKNMIG